MKDLRSILLALTVLLLATAAQAQTTNERHLLKQGHSTCTERQSLNKACGWNGGDRGGLTEWEQFGKRK